MNRRLTCKGINDTFVFGAESFKLNELEQTYVNNYPPDVTFRFPGCSDKVGAHRRVLISRVPEFQCLFQFDMSQKRTSEVYVHNTDPHLFGKLLVYLYTGSLEVPVKDLKQDAGVFNRLHMIAKAFYIPIALMEVDLKEWNLDIPSRSVT